MKLRVLTVFLVWFGASLPVLADALLKQLLAQQPDVAAGQTAYRECRGCHKADGSGRADAGYPQLAGQHRSVLIKQMVDTRMGRRENPRMHPFIEAEAVDAADIPRIAAYLESLPVPADTRKGPGRLLEKGYRLYQRDCTRCHGAEGQGEAARFYPKVSGQHYPYLYRESLDVRDGRRRNADAEMVKVMKGYSDEDIEAVSDFMSRLLPAGRK